MFCFPHAGVGASVYRRWPSGLPADVEMWAIQSPGRENRIREKAWTHIPALVDAIVEALAGLMDRPFALFGHSMGAVLATEVARRLHVAGGPQPLHLIVSGRRPPHIAALEPPLAPLTDAEFIEELRRRYGGIPAVVQRDSALMALFLPCLRADITALEMHQPEPREPLACPITVFGGTEDSLTPREHLDAWRGETTGSFRARVFEGGHFFLEPRRDEVLAEVSAIFAS